MIHFSDSEVDELYHNIAGNMEVVESNLMFVWVDSGGYLVDVGQSRGKFRNKSAAKNALNRRIVDMIRFFRVNNDYPYARISRYDLKELAHAIINKLIENKEIRLEQRVL